MSACTAPRPQAATPGYCTAPTAPQHGSRSWPSSGAGSQYRLQAQRRSSARRRRRQPDSGLTFTHFASWRGRRVGLWGDAAAFSCNQKAITAGEGGVLVAANPEPRDKALLFGHYGKRFGSEIRTDAPYFDFGVTGMGLEERRSGDRGRPALPCGRHRRPPPREPRLIRGRAGR
ncbi:DegT/DnrJ/EryC1/StrS family aminotransferase [Nocardia tengchongensis]|uniref:DegT/DnrJ/EryC1/StrS family aminotransferase n=1 Tax=Nocardia tengchongensis TaxID=2055889 RepID=UPI0036776FA7